MLIHVITLSGNNLSMLYFFVKYFSKNRFSTQPFCFNVFFYGIVLDYTFCRSSFKQDQSWIEKCVSICFLFFLMSCDNLDKQFFCHAKKKERRKLSITRLCLLEYVRVNCCFTQRNERIFIIQNVATEFFECRYQCLFVNFK